MCGADTQQWPARPDRPAQCTAYVGLAYDILSEALQRLMLSAISTCIMAKQHCSNEDRRGVHMWLIEDHSRGALVVAQNVLDELAIASANVDEAIVLAPIIVVHQAIAGCACAYAIMSHGHGAVVYSVKL